MYEKRTDLAIEVRESFPKDDVEIEGVLLQKERCEEVWVTTVEIRNESGAKYMKKPIGTYVTLEFPMGSYQTEELKKSRETVVLQIKRVIQKLIHQIEEDKGKKCPLLFISGLGNRFATPDALNELYEDYGKGENEPYQYEAVEKSVRHFQTFDLKSAEADKGRRSENSEQKKMPKRSWNRTDAESENDGYCNEDDWIEDDEWQEPESDAKYSQSVSVDTSTEDEWFDDEENAEDDWIEDDEWVE